MNIATTYHKWSKTLTATEAPQQAPPAWPAIPASKAKVDFVIPVYNEAAGLEPSVRRLHRYLSEHLRNEWRIVIADNASTDDTYAVARQLSRELRHVRVAHLDEKGRGRALKRVWSASDADILAYMDVDLSTDLAHIPELIEPLTCGQAPIAIGSRLGRGSRVTRGLKREALSRGYNLLLRGLLGARFRDAQCGFKAIRRDAAAQILPDVTDDEWFFDTELLVKAQRRGWVIHETSVTWNDDPDSRVNIPRTVWADLKGIGRLRREASLAPAWEAPALAVLVIGALALYVVGLGASGYANSFYAAAVQAATVSWKAFFFGSFDAASFITVDKPPFALWVMALSARVFGFNSWSMLVPNAVAGAASVWIVARTVRRWFGPVGSILAGLVLALTPVATLMFRFNNPDAILILLMVGSVYAAVRAIESGRTKWLALAGVLLGTAFITKMLQGLVIVPIIAAVYLLAAKPKFWIRIRQLLAAGVALAVSALWWPVAVMLTPAASRPYIGGSTNNSVWDLVLGYNGIGRLLGTAIGSPTRSGSGVTGVVNYGTSTATGTTGQAATGLAAGGFGGGGQGGPGGAMGGSNLAFGGDPGVLRMFNSAFGTEISWLLPLAVVVLVAGLWSRRRQPRTDLIRAGYLLWGGWLLVHGVIFSFMQGTIHPYYSVALAPAIAGLAGMGLPWLWRKHQEAGWAWIWPTIVGSTAAWAFVLLGRSETFVPWLRWTILACGLVVALLWPLAASLKLRRGLVVAGMAVILAGPLSFSLATAAQAHTGSIPTAGPSSSAMGGAMGGPGGNRGGFAGGRQGGFGPGGGMTGSAAGSSSTDTTQSGTSSTSNAASTGQFPSVQMGGGLGGSGSSEGGMTGGPGGMGNQAADSTLVSYLVAHKGSADWIVATTSTITAAPIQLASGEAVMAMGGFNGSDPAPTLAEFQALVAAGKLKYLLVGSGGGGMGNFGSTTQTEILDWVKANGTVVDYGGSGGTLYLING